MTAISYCSCLQTTTAHRRVHEIDGDTETIESTCLTCGAVTPIEYVPAPGTQLQLPGTDDATG